MFPMAKIMLSSQCHGENSQFKGEKSPFCDNLTALSHSKSFCIPNFEMCSLAIIINFLYYLIILYGVEFSQFFYKTMQKIPNSGRVMFPKWGEKPCIISSILTLHLQCDCRICYASYIHCIQTML